MRKFVLPGNFASLISVFVLVYIGNSFREFGKH